MLKSQFDSTDVCSHSSSTDQIAFKIHSHKQYIQLFLNELHSDFKIYHLNTFYPFHKAVLFQQLDMHSLGIQPHAEGLRVPDSLKAHLLIGVISCLYGLQLKICRSEALQALNVIHFFQIDKLKSLVEDDILSNFDDYELFPLLQKAQEINMPQIQEFCWKQLELQNFEQMRYAKYELLQCTENTFRSILVKHGLKKQQDALFGQSQKFIQDLIQQYCRHNSYDEHSKQILLNELSPKGASSFLISESIIPPLRIKSNKEDCEIKIKVYTPRTHSQSMIQPSNYLKSVKSADGVKSMIMDLTFLSKRKRSVSRGSQNNSSQSRNCIEAICLKQECKHQEQMISSLNKDINGLSHRLSEKQSQLNGNRLHLSELQNLLEECEGMLMEADRRFRILQVKVKKVQHKGYSTSMNSTIIEEHNQPNEETKKTNKSIKDQKLKVSLVESRWVCC